MSPILVYNCAVLYADNLISVSPCVVARAKPNLDSQQFRMARSPWPHFRMAEWPLSLQPIWDHNGPRVVPITTYVYNTFKCRIVGSYWPSLHNNRPRTTKGLGGGGYLQNCRKREGAEGDFPLRVLCGLSAETHGKTRLILDVALHIYLYTLI